MLKYEYSETHYLLPPSEVCYLFVALLTYLLTYRLHGAESLLRS